jgi:hypothetical protein
MIIINCKDHINKVMERRTNVHRRKLIKNNREAKMRTHLMVKEANHSKIEIEKNKGSFKKLWDYMEKMHIHNMVRTP